MAENVVVEGINIPVTRAEEYRAVYVNHATGGLTNWELHFTLGTIVENPPGKPAVQEQVMVMMTHDFAKALQGTIAQVVKAYETNRPGATVTAQEPPSEKKD